VLDELLISLDQCAALHKNASTELSWSVGARRVQSTAP
jgi:hypothetical protein